MSTIAHFGVPTANFALAETLRTVPEVSVVCEQIVACSNTGILPLIWARAPDPPTFEDALAHDPTVATYTQLADTEAAQLYRMEWTDHIRLVVQMLTNANAIILDAAGTAEGWQLRVLYPDRETLRTTYDFCDDHDLSVDITTIRTPDADPTTSLSLGGGLTNEQYEALVHAYNQGYFAVPRTVDLETLAADLDISHQALSERLRRAHDTLIGEALNTSLSGRVAAPETNTPTPHRE
jgi:predicted DNA binding protein